MMNIFRKLIGLMFAIVFVAFALPAIGGPTKIYGLDMDVSGTTVIAKIQNLSPPSVGSSNVGSVSLAVDTSVSGLRIAQVLSIEKLDSSGNPVPSFRWTLTPNGPYPTSSIAITNLNLPLKGKETLRVTMLADGCGVGVGWDADVFTGSNLTGSMFTLVTDPGSQQSTDVQCGLIACGGSATVDRTDILSPDVTVIRGPYDSDGACSTANTTRFFINNNLFPPSLTVLLTWPFGVETDTQPEAAFQFDANVTATAAPKLSWKNYAGTTTPAFLTIAANTGLTCSAANSAGDWFPRPYGNLLAAVTPGATKITVSNTGVAWPTVFPTNILIEDELMMVTKITTNNNTWTVTRPHPVPHAVGLSVMYTPLKNLAAPVACANLPSGGTCPYSAGELAKSCLIPTSVDGAYKIIGIGDPVFSGGDL